MTDIYYRKYFIAGILLLIAAGCSEIAHFGSDDVEGRVSNKSLQVYNKLDRPIWYFAVEREAAAFIDWVPTNRDENKIESGTTKHIGLDEIYGYEKKGDVILFYYWTSAEPGAEIHNIVIKTG